MEIRITPDTSGVRRIVQRLETESPIRLAKALTFTAERVREGLRDEIRRVFVGPVPFTLNSLRLKTATAQRLEAEVKFKDKTDAGKGTPAANYIVPHIAGSKRNQKRFESSLYKAGYLPADWVAVPGDAVQLDGNGNVPASVYVRVLSQLRVQRGIGSESRIGGRDFEKDKVSKATQRQGGRFWVGRPGKGTRQPLGIWFRQYVTLDDVTTSVVSPLFIFVPSAQYRKRYDFFVLGNKLIQQHFPIQLERQWGKYVENSFKSVI